MTKHEMATEALDRARNGQSFANYAAIYEGFAAKGILPSEIEPRVNVLTFHAWKAIGRSVKKGEHGVKVCTFVDMSKDVKDPSTGETERKGWRAARTTTVRRGSDIAQQDQD
mgnify:CR=1 FL=1